MKKLFTLFFAIMASLGAFSQHQEDFEWAQIGDLYYLLYPDLSAEVTCKSYPNQDWDISTAEIPSSVTYNNQTYTVKYIGDYAFKNCSSLTSVTIPDSVTFIGNSAFSGCSSLTTITLPNGITSIGNYTFSGCSSLTSIFIPNSVTEIGSSAFYGCSSLTSINIPNSVISIGGSAFYGCSSLTSINIPNSVTSIGNSTFYGCSSLISINIPNTVTSIGNYAFSNCSALTSVTIPNSVTSIGGSAFKDCIRLKSITIPNSVTSIGSSAFFFCTGLTSIEIPNSITNIGTSAFSGCSSLTAVYISDIIAWLAIDFKDQSANPLSYAHNLFINHALVTDLVIPDVVDSINDYAFYGCTSFTSVTIHSGVISIGSSAFNNCSNLNAVYISDITAWCAIDFKTGYSNPLYNANLFLNNTLVTDLVIPDEVESIKDNAFYGCNSLTSITIPNGVTRIGSSAFSGCSGLISITIPNSVTNIGDYAFSKCSNLNAVTIGNGITSIENYTFYKCSNLTSITIPNSVTSIGSYAFKNCSGLTSITIPNSVTNIGGYAFSGCSSLTSVTIGNGVTRIGESAFENCKSLISLTIPDNVTNINNNAFYDVPNIVYFGTATGSPWGARCVNGYIDEYFVYSDETKTNLKACLSYVEGAVMIPNTVTNIGNYAFKNCSGLTSITIPNSVTNIDWYAFYGCSSLTSINIPNSVTSIGSGAFSGCSSLPIENNIRYADTYLVEAVDKTLSSYTIKPNTRWIGSRAFSDCKNLISITIPNSVTNISSYAFDNCDSLASITIPNSVTTIETMTFRSCKGLTSVTIPEGVTRIEQAAFMYCSSLTSISIPNSVTKIANTAFENCTNLASVTIGSGVQEIGYGPGNETFGNCPNLTSVHISDLTAWCRIDFTRSGDNPLYYAHRLYLNNQEITNLVIPEGVTEIKSFTFDQCTSITSLALPNSISTIGNGFWECTNLENIYSSPSTPPTISTYTFRNISPDAVVYVPNQYVKTYKKAQQWKNMNIQEAYSVKDVESSATSASVESIHKGWTIANKYIASVGIEGGESFAGNTLEYIGLEPNSAYNDIPVVLTSNTGETETINVSFTTTELALTTQQPKAVSSNTAILLAATNMADIETSCGFEWKRNDAPADMEGTKVLCPVANGTMAGRLKNLNENVYYKYRAFYQSAAGNMYYGDWQYIFTGDATVEFDPVLYTYAPTAVTETTATLKGYAFAGSDDFTEQGFEYWSESRVNASSALFRMPAALGEHHTVTASGISMRVTLSDLDAGTVYRYRSYAKIGSQIVYGSEMTFATQGTYVPPTYIITFVNWDGTELLTLPEVEEGTLPVYTGETPVRPDDEEFTYTFSGWSPTIVEATSDATYTATFSSQRKEEAIDQITDDQSLITNKIMKDGQILILRGDRVYTVTGQLVK